MFLLKEIWFIISVLDILQLVQLLSNVWLFATPWTAAHQASLSLTNSRSLLKLMSIDITKCFQCSLNFYPILIPNNIFQFSLIELQLVLTIFLIKKQRYHFADKIPYSQSYGFTTIHGVTNNQTQLSD